MTKFVIESHFRLQEWVAEEKGYFRDEGLDYEFRELIRSTEGQHHNKVNEGAFQSIEKGRKADVSCACHWTVNVAASNGHAKLYADVYSVAPSGIFVPADSRIRTPSDLAGVPISVGFQSGSHYSTIQALEPYLAPGEINLTFEDGMVLDNTLLDLSKVKVPVYNLATREDHIAPAESVLYGSQFFGGPVKYVLSGSGHIAGVVNPPASNKYQYWTNDNIKDITVADWMKGAVEHKGSWWPDWREWLGSLDPEEVPARSIGSDALPPIEDAPGSYVRVRA